MELTARELWLMREMYLCGQDEPDLTFEQALEIPCSGETYLESMTAEVNELHPVGGHHGP